MEFFLAVIGIFLLFCSSDSNGVPHNSHEGNLFSDNFRATDNHNSHSQDTDLDHKNGSWFDDYDNEHIIDEDGYCDDCDDYHDDYAY